MRKAGKLTYLLEECNWHVFGTISARSFGDFWLLNQHHNAVAPAAVLDASAVTVVTCRTC